MKKGILLGLVALIVPQIIFAAWWNPVSWFKNKPMEEPIEVQVKSEETVVGENTSGSVNNNSELDSIEEEKIKEVVPEKTVTRTVTVDNPQQAQKIKELTIQLDSANRTITLLRTHIGSLKSQIALLSSVQRTTKSTTPVLDYASYAKLNNIRDYVKNPLPYFDKQIMLKSGLVVNFSPAVDPNKNSSYIHLVDNTGTLSDLGELVLKVDTEVAYSWIADRLKIGDLVNVWGVGARSEEFTVVGGESGQFVTAYKPVITLQQISKCGTNCVDDVYSPIFSE